MTVQSHETGEAEPVIDFMLQRRNGQRLAERSSCAVEPPPADCGQAMETLICRSNLGVSQRMVTKVEALSDHELLLATRDGDETAFQELVRRYRNPITNFVYRMLDDYDKAVDLAQETFVRVYTSADRYRADFSFSTYIYRIASNLAITELRQRKRRRLVPLFSFFTNDDGEQVEIDFPDARPLQDTTMIDEERRRAVQRAISSLPEKYRVALVLRDVEGLSYERITEILSLSEGTVKSRINRARNLLKDKLSAFV